MARVNFRNVPVFLDRGNQSLDKVVFSRNGLTLDLPPERFLANTPRDELTVFLLSVRSLSAGLSEHPINGETGRGR